MIWVLTTLFFVQLPLARAELADKIVSVVGNEAITLSEVEFEDALRARDQSPIPSFTDSSKSSLAQLEEIRVIRRLAGQVAVFQPDPRDVDSRVAAIRRNFDSADAYDAFRALLGGATEDPEEALRRYLHTRLVVEAYVHRNVGLPLAASMTDRGDDYINAYRARYAEWISPRRAEAKIYRIGDEPAP